MSFSASESVSPALVSPDEISLEKLSSSPPLKLGIMASGTGSNFVAIADAIAQHHLAAHIQVVIYNNPDAPVAQRAQERQIPTHLINHRHFSTREVFDQQIVDRLREADVDWVVMVGWMRRVTQVLIDAFPDRMINIHPSLLPSFPGIRAIEQALEHQVKISGCTVHIVRLEVDSGPILIQAAVPVYPEDTPASLHRRIQIQEHRIIVQAIAQLIQNRLTPCRQ
ncbi:phosphoribosylglycinamide formyltransferase [Acaryochloris marina]|uniref:Phosphoribosylglycinamide formyltransferase n=1 Tax=Acaryochloris marina (strain MBIC 11017) TaxID=329726 RepID=B0CET9_ACAM1|nr:phosphoribosylglycinamide formyltransferase [Acaryochloris marina]ABW29336.1 phosphoribosylglycinamide formyltransferase [Acaryochloris marina MBIC11017]BDM78256.1 phosphoribosylglycinamide formyltransferase [Acaryochloris marina MBIC10699]